MSKLPECYSSSVYSTTRMEFIEEERKLESEKQDVMQATWA
jgi:hypothetical protein